MMSPPNGFGDPAPGAVSRREAVSVLAAGALSVLGLGCGSPTGFEGGGTGRLSARPSTPTSSLGPGVTSLGLGSGSRDGLVFVPAGYQATTPVALAVLLHGAGQGAHEMMDPIRVIADPLGLALLAPDSRSGTWDVVQGGYGPDTAFLDAALAFVFDRVTVDPARVRLAGFSDGASTVLGLGRVNGDLFGRVAAFSPGFIAPGAATGRPSFFITHGTRDPVLSVANTRNAIVPTLRNAGYEVEYHEFDGGHGVNPALLQTAVEWLAA